MVVRLNTKGGAPMYQIVLKNADDIIIDTAKASGKIEILETLAKWLLKYEILNHDRITFYRFKEED